MEGVPGAKKYTTGYTCGVFDLFHVGHLNLLERCKARCEHLIVGVCDDAYVRDVKGVACVVPAEDRARIVDALKVVDRVEIIDAETTGDKMLALSKFGFDVLFSGDDWKGSERYLRTEEQFARLGVAIEYLPYTQGISTTLLKDSLLAESVQQRNICGIEGRGVADKSVKECSRKAVR